MQQMNETICQMANIQKSVSGKLDYIVENFNSESESESDNNSLEASGEESEVEPPLKKRRQEGHVLKPRNDEDPKKEKAPPSGVTRRVDKQKAGMSQPISRTDVPNKDIAPPTHKSNTESGNNISVLDKITDSPSTSTNTGIADKPISVNKIKSDILDKQVSRLVVKEQTIPAINKKLADIVNNLNRNKMKDEQRKQIVDKHLRPNNMEDVFKAPKINDVLWGTINTSNRIQGIRFQSLQGQFSKASIPVVNAIDKIVKSIDEATELDKEEIVGMLTDSVALTMGASYDLSLERRKFLRDDLGKDYKALLSSKVVITEYLFSDKASEEMEKIEKTNKVKDKVQESKDKKKDKERKKRSGFKSFLGKRFSKQHLPNAWQGGKGRQGYHQYNKNSQYHQSPRFKKKGEKK